MQKVTTGAFLRYRGPPLRVPPVLQGQPQSCGIGFIFAHQHAHPLGVAFAFFQGYGQEVILGFEVFNTATKEEKSQFHTRSQVICQYFSGLIWIQAGNTG